MFNGIITIISILSVIGGITTLINLWISENQKNQLIVTLREIYATLNNSDPIAVIQAPMRGVEYIYKIVLGEKIAPFSSIKRTALVSILILIGSLAFAGWIINKPFAIELTPWGVYESYTSKLPSSIEEIARKDKLSEEKKADMIELAKKLSKPIWKWVYSVSLILLVVLIKVSFDLLSFAVTRKFLRELLTTKQPLLIFSALFLNIVLASVIVSFTFLLLTAVTNPLVLLFLIMSFMVPLNLYTIFSLAPVLWGATIKFAWLFGLKWIKLTALTTMLPTAILLLLILVVFVTLPIRSHIQKIICYTLERLINYEKGPLIFISACLLALVSILGGMIKLFLM